ncbi:MAG: T9SS C-terminal target domain-containing protein [Bacteroidia bacterium]|nr:MAG: T9SS C-terminal target domain-containing protein [Bacteroidia bacterium]
MKKQMQPFTQLLFLLLIIGMASPVKTIPVVKDDNAQSLPYYEDFSDVADFQLPAGWSSTNPNWHVFNLWAMPNLNWPGGKVLLLWDNAFNPDIISVISPQIDATGTSAVSLTFGHLVIHNTGSYTLKLQTSIDGVNWTDQWSLLVDDGNVPLTEVSIALNDVAGETFQMAFVADHSGGETNDLDTWAISEVHIADASGDNFYTLTFVVEDHDGNPVNNAVISLDDLTNPEGNYVFPDLPPGSYNFSAIAEGYESAEGVVDIVDEDLTEIIILNELTSYVVTFEIEDHLGQPVPDAVITLGDITNDAGNYVFEDIWPGEYDYLVAVEDYFPEEGTLTVVDQDITHLVVLTEIPLYSVIFVITDESNNPVENAIVSLDGITNDEGDYHFEGFEEGSYNYIVEAPGFQIVTSGLTVEEDTILEVMLPQELIIASFPWFEDFDIDPFFPPAGWNHFVMGEGGGWERSIGGPNGLYMALHSRVPWSFANNWLVSPKIAIPEHADLANYVMRLVEENRFMAHYDYSGVKISSGSGNPLSGDFVEIFESDQPLLEYTEQVFDFSEYAGQNIFIAFVYQGQMAHVWRLDAVFVEGDPLYDVTFVVEDEWGNHIHHAIVNLGDVTNEAGDYTFHNLQPGDYSYHLTAEGFYDESGILTIEDAHIVEYVIMNRLRYTVTFELFDNQTGEAVSGATITLGGTENDPGDYVFEDILPDSYDFHIVKDGYFDETGNLTVIEEDKLVTIYLGVDDTGYGIATMPEITVYPNPAGSMINILLDTQDVAVVRLKDIAGRELYYSVTNDKHYRLNTEHFNAGLYLLVITTSQGVSVHKIQLAD